MRGDASGTAGVPSQNRYGASGGVTPIHGSSGHELLAADNDVTRGWQRERFHHVPRV